MPQDQKDGNLSRWIRIEYVSNYHEVHATSVDLVDWHPIARFFDSENEARQWADDQTGTNFQGR